ncbi:hypothetical protein KA057_02785 [Candidatus Gracilibacteria bacterium]|nr:hypothetical protein [Candidatus Gracilibacteria bacterium]
MTTSTEAPGAPELPLAHSLESTPVTVVEGSHADVLHALDTPSKYTQLIREHAEMMRAGKSSHEIIRHLGVELGIESWKNQKHHGLFMALSTPAEQEMENFKGFLLALGLDPALSVMAARRPEFLLLDGRIPQALVGPKNMIQADELLRKIDADWKALGDDDNAKATYLKDNFGIDIDGNWANELVGVGSLKGGTEGGFGLGASGSLDGEKVLRLWLTNVGKKSQGGSTVGLGNPANARMFLIGELPTGK